MRVLGISIAVLLLSGCSVLDQITLNGPPKLDPSKVYLGRSAILARPRELDRYACVNGPLQCTSHGIMLECVCPR